MLGWCGCCASRELGQSGISSAPISNKMKTAWKWLIRKASAIWDETAVKMRECVVEWNTRRYFSKIAKEESVHNHNCGGHMKMAFGAEHWNARMIVCGSAVSIYCFWPSWLSCGGLVQPRPISRLFGICSWDIGQGIPFGWLWLYVMWIVRISSSWFGVGFAAVVGRLPLGSSLGSAIT